MSAWGDGSWDLGQVQAHGVGGAPRQPEVSTFTFSLEDRPEDVGGLRALVLGDRVPRLV